MVTFSCVDVNSWTWQKMSGKKGMKENWRFEEKQV